MSSTQGSFVDSVIMAARENPVAAALIGGGALWLLIGNEKLKSAASLATASFPQPILARAVSDQRAQAYESTQAPPTAPEMDHEGSFGLGETLRHASNAASDTVSKAADQMKDRFEKVPTMRAIILASWAKRFLEQRHSHVRNLHFPIYFERQPLVLGAVGLAVGPRLPVHSGHSTSKMNGSASTAMASRKT